MGAPTWPPYPRGGSGRPGGAIVTGDGPDMAPHTPRWLGAPRRSHRYRRWPRHGPPYPELARDAPAEPWTPRYPPRWAPTWPIPARRLGAPRRSRGTPRYRRWPRHGPHPHELARGAPAAPPVPAIA